MKTGHTLIREERLRQQQVEGWTESHDDTHTAKQLAKAAFSYLIIHTAPDADKPPRPARTNAVQTAK